MCYESRSFSSWQRCSGPLDSNIVCIIMIHAQAMEERRVRQVKIVEALEAEKKKISRELEEMQMKRTFRNNHTPQHGERSGVPDECIL